MSKKVLVIGMGKVGHLVGVLLKETGFDVTGMDRSLPTDLSFPILQGDVAQEASLRSALEGRWAVVSCLPYHLNLPVARLAHDMGIHYFDLTEDVPTTKAIHKMASTSNSLLAPQCGLAPGFIAIVGASLAAPFQTIQNIHLRVGALPQNPSGLLGYAFLWSPEGVVNEYLNDCEAIEDGVIKMIPAMEGLETIVIHGNRLEAFTTSGGLGSMCETYAGKIKHLNYKTMRYPGHCELMRFFFHELRMRENREEAGRILVKAKPPVNDDVVYVHAAVEGMKKGKDFREEFVRAYKPMKIAGQMWRAISWTTAGSAVAVVQMVAEGLLPSRGFLKQEEISLDAFLKTHTGRFFLQ